MRPLALLERTEVSGLLGLLFDLDDTVLTHGRLTLDAYAALSALSDSGLRLVAVTGRPASWGELLVRQWPVDGAVTENGAVALVREGRGVRRVDSCAPAEREHRRARLGSLVAAVREAVPAARLADDVEGRVSDVAWDIGEREQLPEQAIARIVGLANERGARTTRSSVHLHATLDGADKASGAVSFLAGAFGDDVTAALSRYAYVGDSANDAACFAAFACTFGVANVAAHAGRLSVAPRWVAPRAMGEGFVDVATAILERRR